MRWKAISVIVFAVAVAIADCNSEGDALYAWKVSVSDPNNVLESWDPSLVNPCTWMHVTCNSLNTVTRLDLGRANLSGPLVPQLGMLPNLQYLEVYDNNLSGPIPRQLGKLRQLISLDLYHNQLSGPIPQQLGELTSLRYLRLNGNKLSGILPDTIIQLVKYGHLQILDVSDNQLTGTVRATHKRGFAITTIVQDPKAAN